jgi:hypothetical protein
MRLLSPLLPETIYKHPRHYAITVTSCDILKEIDVINYER